MSAQRSSPISRLHRSLPPEYESVSATEARLRQRALGAGLREIYADVVEEPAPEEFLTILQSAGRRRR
jgi:hypothetical protein